MGQSPSTTASRHDNASTRTLHSTSMISNRNSNRPFSFFRRISNRLSSTHPTRRFGQNRTTDTSGSSTTSSVRRATQEAARAAAAVTGPPALPSFFMQTPTQSSRNSITSATESFWNELITSPVFRETNNDNSFLRYLNVPLRVQQEINATMDDLSPPPPPPPPQSSSASSTTTARRMHILVIEYRSNNNNNSNNNNYNIHNSNTTTTSSNNNNNNSNNNNIANTNDSLPSYRFLGLRRPRSEVSTSSSTDTIQSMPLSMSSNQPIQENGGQWMVYVLNNQHSFQALSSSLLLEDNPSYEDLLWLSNMLGTVRPNTTTQAAVDEAIPVTDWSQDIKDESCLVCLDEFVLKQQVRVLKCQHVFHRECVDRWLCEAHNSCPVCRGVPVEN